VPDETQYWGKPADPATKECDWCGYDSTARHSFPVYRKAGQRSKGIPPAQFIYACEQHKRLAKEASESTGTRQAA
jgi:hypothetical protein